MVLDQRAPPAWCLSTAAPPAPLLFGEEEEGAAVRRRARAVSPQCVLIPSVVASSSSPAPTCRSDPRSFWKLLCSFPECRLFNHHRQNPCNYGVQICDKGFLLPLRWAAPRGSSSPACPVARGPGCSRGQWDRSVLPRAKQERSTGDTGRSGSR